jgi:peptidoglycan/xylan/chitin deacetylase (PgdA/CDA1 family)
VLSALLLAAVQGSAAAAPGISPSPRQWRSEEFLILLAEGAVDAATLAALHLGDRTLEWRIRDANGRERFAAGDEVVIPLTELRPLGISRSSYQVLPVLVYHRFSPSEKGRLVIPREEFRRQMAHLAREGYRVVPLRLLEEFVAGKGELPPKAVAISVDDGYRSFHEIAYPILREFGFPATLFIYSDFIGAGAALTWEQIREMEASGLVSVEAHGKAHLDLTAVEGAGAAPVEEELVAPRGIFQRRLGRHPRHLAYPFGRVSAPVARLAKLRGYRLGLTIERGGNPFFQDPLFLRRDVVYGDDDFSRFTLLLGTEVPFREAP